MKLRPVMSGEEFDTLSKSWIGNADDEYFKVPQNSKNKVAFMHIVNKHYNNMKKKTTQDSWTSRYMADLSTKIGLTIWVSSARCEWWFEAVERYGFAYNIVAACQKGIIVQLISQNKAW